MITPERLREVLDYEPETGKFRWKVQLAPRGKVGAEAGCRDARGRIHIRIDGQIYLAHRLAWLHVHGAWPSSEIDHRDRGQSNALRNLRPATHLQNSWNRGSHKDSASPSVGVSFDRARKKWRAQISVDGRKKFLGRFDCECDAAKAYQAAAVSSYGEFAVIS